MSAAASPLVSPGVVIVGGGIAGLAAAWELFRRGVPFTLFERSGRAGGVILSEQVGEFTVDAGPDSLLVQKPEGIRLCEEVGLGPALVPTLPPRLAYIQRAGRLHPLAASSVLGIPTEIGPFVTTRLFSWRAKLRMALEPLIPPRRDDVDESIGGFVTRRFGREAAMYLAEPLLAGIHAGDVDRLSIRALFPRFVDAERKHGSLIRAFRAERRPPSSTGAFRSLPGGLSELIRALTAQLPPDSMQLNTTIVRLSGGGPAASIAIETSRGDAVSAGAVILATPAYATAPLLRELDAELAGLCSEIQYASTATVVLGFQRTDIAHPLNGSGFVVPRVEHQGILAGSWMSSKWPHRAPEGKALLRTFVGGARDPGALELSDAALVDRSVQALRPLIGLRGEPLLARVYRWERSTAQHDVGHLARVETIDRGLSRRPGLFLTGSGFRGIGIPDCIADGRATARAAADFVANVDKQRKAAGPKPASR
jgi:oxygen-dependent protoporphyrinogen oxidase